MRVVYVFRSALTLLVLMTMLLGGFYSLVVLGIAQALFPDKANGSLIPVDGGTYHGSMLLGQSFTQAKYFWGRLSATTPPYNAAASQGSNLSPANPKLLDAAQARIAALQKADPKNKDAIPVDLITASASGLDPHISIAAAEYQAPRVARARGMKETEVRQLIEQYREGYNLGGFGRSYVNVVLLNLALDRHSGKKK